MKHPNKLLQELDIAPLKSFGQNFLTSNQHLNFLDNYLKDMDNHSVLEIGPGFGAVTEHCLEFLTSMYVVEKDKMLCHYLNNHFHLQKSIVVIEQDFLLLDEIFFTTNNIHTVIGNLPFNITTAIITSIVLHQKNIALCVFGVQEEYANKLIDKKLSSLSVLLRTLGEVKIEQKMNSNNFYPKPNVNVCWFSWKRKHQIEDKNIPNFEFFLRILFWGKRKKIYNSIRKSQRTPKNWIHKIETTADIKILEIIKQRVDNLEIKDIIYLFYFLSSLSDSSSLASTS